MTRPETTGSPPELTSSSELPPESVLGVTIFTAAATLFFRLRRGGGLPLENPAISTSDDDNLSLVRAAFADFVALSIVPAKVCT